MAKSKTAHLVPYQFRPPTPMPMVITKTRTVHAKAKPRRHHGGASSKSKVISVTVAGFVLGHIDKSGSAFPTVPMLGRAGTIAAAAYFLGKGRGIWGDVMVAAAAIAGYEFGSTGKIAGGNIAPQVAGIAAQT